TAIGLGVAFQRAGVPDANRVVVAGGGELIAIVTERCVGDYVGVGEDREHLPTRGSVQESQGAIEAGHGDPFAIRAEDNGAAPPHVALLVNLHFPLWSCPRS